MKPKSGKKKKTSRKTGLITLVAFIIAAICVGMFVPWYMGHRMGAFEKDGEIRVKEGMTYEELVSQVNENLKPLHPRIFARVMEEEKVKGHLYPGLYRLRSSDPAIYLARAVTRGWQNPIDLVITAPVRTTRDLAAKIASQMMVSEEELMEAFTNDRLLSNYGTDSQHLFEFVIPDTYQLFWSTSVEAILNRLKKEYDAFWTEERVNAAAAQGLTPQQVSILASIVAEESNRRDEYPKIASVYITRLQRGMRLQACPTIRYIYGYSIRRVLNKHLENPSPYNTYMYEGLPPTPIALPGKEHLEAVLHPDKAQYLYFCADASFNGRNVFSRTFAEHQVKAAAYRKALDGRRQRDKEELDDVIGNE